ncbi:uncharacterized protein LOC129312394 [Prosopis cineraria]|uniref:uncharacterized protein LOC129312394 n=1 Tax=Prosopis cineraria TaxID=364024 RepID=UPI002410106F|nr:uncharacterized protein LOC129312394 [Prosopis cineraria]
MLQSEVNKKQFDGSFIPKGRHDILTVAIGKPEHLGHVQGIRSRVSIRDIFGPPRQRNPSRLVTREEVTAMLAQAKAEVEVTLEVRLQKMKEEMLMQMSSQKVSNAPHTPSLTCHWSTKESNIVQLPSKDDPTPNLEQCFLYVENIKKCLVARGRIHEDVVKVTIEEVKIDDADIPFPTDKIKTVKDAKGTFTLWPKRLVRMPQNSETPSFDKVGEKMQLCKLSSWDHFVLLAYGGSFPPRIFKAVPDFVGINNYQVFVENEDLSRILIDGDQTMTNIQIGMMFLYQMLVSSGKDKQYGFLCPRYTNDNETTKETKEEYMNQRLSEGDKECYFSLFLHLAHWQLIVFSMKNNSILFLCSLHHKLNPAMKKSCEQAMRIGQQVRLGKTLHDVKNPTWITPKSRHQPPTNLCGFYVLRHVYNIITAGLIELTEEMFNDSSPFSQSEIQEIRRYWGLFMLELHNNNPLNE